MHHAASRRSVLARALLALGILGGAALAPIHAQAQTYPSKPVRIIVPFPPGGPVDITGRGVAQKLAELWGQPVTIDNRAGAGGIVGAEVAAKAPNDGYTIFMCAIHHSVIPALKSKLSYDIEKDFAPVSFGATFPIVLVTHPSLPVANVRELVAYAKANPGKLSFSSSGNGGGVHLSAELFKSLAHVDMNHVPYKGSAPAMTDLLGGQVQLMFSDAPTALPHVRTGKLKALGVGSPKRSALLPDLPTIAESGLPGYESYSWTAFVLPAGAPKEVVAKLNADLNKVMSQPELKERMLTAGAELQPSTPEEFARTLKTEIAKWGKLVREAKITAD